MHWGCGPSLYCRTDTEKMDYMIKTYSMGANPIVAIIIFSSDPSEIFRKCSYVMEKK
jgi:hypothetical protein